MQSLFSKPASSIPIANGANPLNKGTSEAAHSQTISRPRFSMSAATQTNNSFIRKSLGETWKPLSATLNAAKQNVPIAPITRPGLSSANSIRDHTKKILERERTIEAPKIGVN